MALLCLLVMEVLQKKWSEEIQAGSVGINVPIPLPTYAHSFGGWKDSGFSETKAFGPSSIDFYTKTKSFNHSMA